MNACGIRIDTGKWGERKKETKKRIHRDRKRCTYVRVFVREERKTFLFCTLGLQQIKMDRTAVYVVICRTQDVLTVLL